MLYVWYDTFLMRPFLSGWPRCVDNQLVWDGHENSTKLPFSLPQKVSRVFCSLVPKNSEAFFGVLCKEMWTDVGLGRNIHERTMDGVWLYCKKQNREIWESVFTLSLLFLLSSYPYPFELCYKMIYFFAFYFTFNNSFACHSPISLPPSTDVAVSREKKITGHCLRTLSRTCYQQLTNRSGLLQSFCSVCLVDYWLVWNPCWIKRYQFGKLFDSFETFYSMHLPFCSHQVHQFSNKQTEMALRVASLDYLGTVAARLRKDAVTSKMDQRSIDRILQQVE